MNGAALTLGVVFVVLALSVALWLAARRIGRGGGFTLTRLTQLAPDARAGWVHVLGARRSIPEHGDSIDRWSHSMVEPRTGRWLFGESAVGGDLTLSAPLVDRSFEALEPRLGWRPRLARGGALRVVVRRADDAAADAPSTGLAVDVRPRARETAAERCVATLHVAGRALGTHAFEAIGDARFFGCVVEDARVALFSYVGVAWGEPEAHLVALDLDSGALLFDRGCAHQPE